MTMVEGAPLSQLIYRQAAASNQEIFNRLARPGQHPRLPFPIPLTSGLFPRIPAPFPGLPGEQPAPPRPPFPPFLHPFSQFPGRPFPFPASLPPHHFLPNFKNEREVDGGKGCHKAVRRVVATTSAGLVWYPRCISSLYWFYVLSSVLDKMLFVSAFFLVI